MLVRVVVITKEMIMLNKKLLLFASVIMATAGDKEISTPQPDIVITNHPNYKGNKIIEEFKITTLNAIKNDTLSNDEKAKACELFKWLCDHFYYAFEEQFFQKNNDIQNLMLKDIKDDIYNKNNLKDQKDFESFISYEYWKFINNIYYLDAVYDYFKDCAKKYLAGCDVSTTDILQ